MKLHLSPKLCQGKDRIPQQYQEQHKLVRHFLSEALNKLLRLWEAIQFTSKFSPGIVNKGGYHFLIFVTPE